VADLEKQKQKLAAEFEKNFIFKIRLGTKFAQKKFKFRPKIGRK